MNLPNNTLPLSNKKVLLISYFFPPGVEVGGLRIAYFAKHLPAFGWEPSVLTVKERYLRRIDRHRERDIAGVKVIRALVLPTIMDLYSSLKRVIFRVLQGRPIGIEEMERSSAEERSVPASTESVGRRIKRYFLSLLTLPDGARNWVLPAVLKAVSEIREHDISCILTSSPPDSTHLIGLLVKVMTGVRWVADFRDPWTIAGPKRLYANSALSLKIGKWLERQVIGKADLILSTTQPLVKAFQNLYQDEHPDKFIFLPNGFDSQKILSLGPSDKYERFTLSYTGTFYLGRTPEPIFMAIRELSGEGRINLSDISVKLVGNCQHIEGRPTSAVIGQYGLRNVVEVNEPVSYLKSLEIIKRSHVALLLASSQPYQIPAKAFDYIGLGTSILALTEDGATRDLILATKTGSAVDPADVHGIKEYICRSLQNRNGPAAGPPLESLRAFDRRQLTNALADHLDRLIQTDRKRKAVQGNSQHDG